MKNALPIIIIVVALCGAGIYFLSQSKENPSSPTLANQATGEPTLTIVRTDEGYEPSEVTIKKGDIILWTNESSEYHWPASDLHPTHGIYPEFDPRKPIAPGDEWSFKFDQTGEWKFHDHLRANKIGTVTVTE